MCNYNPHYDLDQQDPQNVSLRVSFCSVTINNNGTNKGAICDTDKHKINMIKINDTD